MGVPYLLSHYALALSVFPQFRAGSYDGEPESGDGGWTPLWLDGDGDDDDD